MASHLEALPTELLDAILICMSPEEANLDLKDLTNPSCSNDFPFQPLANLNQTSRTLHLHCEPFLYGSVLARDVAMDRALCTGNVETIRKAMEYGASPHTTGQKILVWNRQVSTLKLALRSGQLDAARFLMDQGARLNDAVESHPKSMRRLLLKPWNEEFLRAYLLEKTSTSSEVLEQKPGQLWNTLVPIIPLVPADLLAVLLDRGAGPNQIFRASNKQNLSPLSAAVVARRPSHFKTLLSRGASINGRNLALKQRDNNPMHIPVIAAAAHMNDKAGLAMMQMCLDHGANINRPCHTDGCPPPKPVPRAWDELQDDLPHWHACTTALLTYLDSIDSWPGDSAPPRDIQASSLPGGPLEAVAYLLDKGADAVSPPLRPIFQQPELEQLESWDPHGANWREELKERTWKGAPSAIELLLDRWGLETLAVPDFFAVLRLLIQHGAARPGPVMGRILVKYEGNGAETVSNWKRLLDLLITDIKQSNISLDLLLRRVIGDKSGLLNDLHHRQWLGKGEVGRATIDALLAAGADINAHHERPSKNEAINPWAYTSLIEVCSLFVHTDQVYSDLHDHTDGHPCAHSLEMEGIYREWLAFLVSRGADPDLRDPEFPRDCVTGLSAIDILEHPMRSGMAGKGGSMEKHMMRLVAAVRGTSEELEYEGERKPYQETLGAFDSRWRHPSGSDCLATEF